MLFPGDESTVLQSVGLKEHTLIKSLGNRPEQKKEKKKSIKFLKMLNIHLQTQ